MNISKIPSATKIANVVLTEGKPLNKPIRFDYVADRETLKKEEANVYFMCVDGEIRKIGGSSAKGGIKQGTLSFYQSGMGGSPSIRTFGVPIQMFAELLDGHTVEIYALFIPNNTIPVVGLNGVEVREVKASHKDSEELCIDQYQEETGEKPEWNHQERGEQQAPGIIEFYNWYRPHSRRPKTFTKSDWSEFGSLRDKAVESYLKVVYNK